MLTVCSCRYLILGLQSLLQKLVKEKLPLQKLWVLLAIWLQSKYIRGIDLVNHLPALCFFHHFTDLSFYRYLRDGLATTKSDVYAFGVVLFELISGKEAITRTEGRILTHTERRSLASIVSLPVPIDLKIAISGVRYHAIKDSSKTIRAKLFVFIHPVCFFLSLSHRNFNVYYLIIHHY